MYDYAKIIELFLKTIKLAEDENRTGQDMIDYENKYTQDILHKLELEDLKYGERAKLATKLKKSRQSRRISKDTIEVTEPILNWISDNKKSIEQLKQLLGKVRKINNMQKDRVYNPRVMN